MPTQVEHILAACEPLTADAMDGYRQLLEAMLRQARRDLHGKNPQRVALNLAWLQSDDFYELCLGLLNVDPELLAKQLVYLAKHYAH